MRGSGGRPDPEALLRLPGPLLSRLRRAAVDARFDGTLVARAEAIARGQFDAVRLPLVHAWLRALDEPVAIWARLFAYRDAVDPARVRDALGDEVAAALREVGVLTDDADGLRSSLRLMPFADLLVASDEVDARFDPVMGPGATTIELWRAARVPEGARVLDIGCGAGSLALAAARHGAGEVVGVDLDPRAVAYARFNAALNELTGTFEVGDLLEPVRGRAFDLVLSQPPFVMRPPSLEATTYLHGGTRGDELTMRLLGELPPVLAPGGRALVLFDTAGSAAGAGDPGPSIMTRVRAALASGDLQVIAIVANGFDPDHQAMGYAAATHSELGPEYAATARTYRDHLRALGIESTAHVLLDVHRPATDAPPFAATLEPRGAIYDAAAMEELRAGLALASSSPDVLRTARVRPSPHAWLSQERALADRERVQYRVRFDRGRARDQSLSEAAAVLVDLLARTPTIDAAVDEYARACGSSPSEVENAVLGFVRDGLVSGLLVRAEE